MGNRNKRPVSLCEDVLLNILFRLSKRDVLKCKCVSNEWSRIVTHVFVPLLSAQTPFSGVYFRLARINAMPPSINNCRQHVKDKLHHLLAYDGSIHSIDSASLEPRIRPFYLTCTFGRPCSDEMRLGSLLPFDHSGPDFLDCCNGLVLFVQRPKPRFFVCNPAIQQCVPLPLPPPSVRMSSLYASLAFEPSESIEYQVVIATLATHPQCLHVFSSQTGEWKTHEVQIEFPTSAKSFKLVRHSVYLKHAVYRLSMFSKILCFDLKSMKARVINCPCQKSPSTQPNYEKDGPPPGCIGVSNGVFAYVADEDGHICVWLLSKPDESPYWTLKYKISYDYIWNRLVARSRNIGWLRCCGFHPTSNTLFFGAAFSFYKYDIDKDCLKLVRFSNTYDEMQCGFFFPVFLHKSVFITLKNWCKGVTANVDKYKDIQDSWCYIEQ